MPFTEKEDPRSILRIFTLLILVLSLAACSFAPASPVPATITPDFNTTKLFQLTAEMETATANAPKNQATVDSILATKKAGGTSVAGTLTAMPTLTLTPTIPSSSPDCQAKDLRAGFAGAQGATQSIVFGVNLTSISTQPCFLKTWPQVTLVDPAGSLLAIHYAYSGPSGLSYDPAAMLGLPPGRTAGFSLQWGNWCLPPVTAGVLVRLVLAGNGGDLTISTGLTAGGVCNDPSSPAWVTIIPLSLQ